eukprot:2111657-Amphidinium_carterae.2
MWILTDKNTIEAGLTGETGSECLSDRLYRLKQNWNAVQHSFRASRRSRSLRHLIDLYCYRTEEASYLGYSLEPAERPPPLPPPEDEEFKKKEMTAQKESQKSYRYLWKELRNKCGLRMNGELMSEELTEKMIEKDLGPGRKEDIVKDSREENVTFKQPPGDKGAERKCWEESVNKE